MLQVWQRFITHIQTHDEQPLASKTGYVWDIMPGTDTIRWQWQDNTPSTQLPTIFATPFFAGEDDLPIEIFVGEENEPVDEFTLPFAHTTPDSDIRKYFSIMECITREVKLRQICKGLAPAECDAQVRHSYGEEE